MPVSFTKRLLFLQLLLLTALLSLPAGRSVKAEEKGSEQPVLKQASIPESLTGSLKAIHERMSRDLKPEDNVAVDLIQLLGDEAIDSELYPETLDMLGIEALAKDSPKFISLDRHAESVLQKSGIEVKRLALQTNEQLINGCERLWKESEFPELTAYLDANAKVLDNIVVATKKPRYYYPLLSAEEPSRLVSASLSLERRLPFLGRMLSARALGKAQQGEFESAVQDLVAAHKLAYLLAKGSPFDVSVAKAHTIDAFASRAEEALIESGELTGPQATILAAELQALPELPMSEEAADIGERAILHQEIELLQSDKSSLEGFFEDDAPGKENQAPRKPEEAELAKLQWDAAMAKADEVQDETVKALATRDHEEQAKLFAVLDQKFEKWNESVDAETEKMAENLTKDPKAASTWLGETMAMSLRPLYWQRRHTDDRARVRRGITLTALALVRYQADVGDFPKSLAELAPKYLKTVPLDAHRDEPFFYARDSKTTARLISWGGNRVDDAGKNFNDDQIFELRAVEAN